LTGIRLKAKMRTEIEHYLSQAGTDPFQRWLDGLADLRCRVAVLLCGGSKRSQSADISAAVARWADYEERQ
jgi:putative component of toxin-antitoxin plasmid stabilization module